MVTIIISVNFKLDPPDQVAASSRNLISSTNSNVNVNAIAQQSSRSKLQRKTRPRLRKFQNVTSSLRATDAPVRNSASIQSAAPVKCKFESFIAISADENFTPTASSFELPFISSDFHNFNICIIYDLLYHSISVSSVVKTQMIYEKNCEN